MRRRRELGPVFFSAFVIWDERFELLALPLPEYADEVLDILGIVHHLARMVTFDGEGYAEAYLVKIDLLVVVKDVFVKHLTDGRVVAVKELNHLDRGVDESGD